MPSSGAAQAELKAEADAAGFCPLSHCYMKQRKLKVKLIFCISMIQLISGVGHFLLVIYLRLDQILLISPYSVITHHE